MVSNRKTFSLALLLTLIASPVSAGSTSLFVNSSNGNVGIQTISPTNALSFDGTAARTIWMERGTTIGNNLTLQAGGGVSAGTNENGGNLILSSGISTGTGSSEIQFNVYPAGSSGSTDNSAITAMEILGSGDVGIGNSAPTAILDIGNGTSGNIYGLIQGNDQISGSGNAATLVYGVYAGQTGGGATGYSQGPFIGSATNHNLALRTDNLDRVVVSSGGNVGIGTISPQATLDVTGFARLKLNSSAPATCSSSNEGSIALTHLAQVCVCDTTPAWHILNSATACSW